MQHPQNRNKSLTSNIAAYATLRWMPILLGLGDRRDVVLRVIKTHVAGADVPEYVRKRHPQIDTLNGLFLARSLTSFVRMSILNNQQFPRVDF